MLFNRQLKVTSFSRKNEKYKKRLLPLILIGVILLGMLYQRLSIHFTASKLGRMGKLVTVNGKNMHLYESDSLNSDIPLVFTANIGNSVPYVDLYPIHKPLSETTDVLVYDRPGYGWSDLTSKPRDIDTICEEIHTLLHSKDDPDDEDESLQPFIYVAQGMGALEAIRYTQLYPEDVAGIVFIEGTSPSFCADYNNIMIIESFMLNALRNTGFLRLIGSSSFTNTAVNDNPELPTHLRQLNKGIGLDIAWNRNVISEKLSISENAKKIIEDFDENYLGDLPLYVITSKSNTYTNWTRCQNALKSLSTDTKQFMIEDSTTVINESDVPTIVSAINELIHHIEELREDY